MTQNVEYVPTDTSLKEAAELMRRLDAGFLPIGNSSKGKLQGVVTDRDIAVRGVAQGLDPNSATVEEVKTGKVLYCYEGESLEDAARHMGEQKVYRLIVLDNDQDKRMTGVISLADIARHSGNTLSGKATAEITH
ncbi:MAG: CBS domain-containing protein [Lysobacterales bacterium]|jgi:CBS domain-containing protein